MGVSIQIDEPPLAPANTSVRCANPLNPVGPGSICACGNAAKDGLQLTSVWAAVIPLLTGTQGLPSSHTMASNPTQCMSLNNPTAGDWSFQGTNLVGSVSCGSSPVTAANATFVVWCSFADDYGIEHPQGRNIAAVCAGTTDCDGSGNPCSEGAMFQRARPAATTTSTTVATAPRQYQVQAQGARGPLALHLNTTWALALKTGGCGCTFAWDNEGDGVRVPRVVLRPDGLISTEWNLTLVLNGRRAHYTCPAPKWKALGVNRMKRASGDDSLPKTLTVTPV